MCLFAVYLQNSWEEFMKPHDQAIYRTRLLELRKRLMREVNASEEALREDVMTPGGTTAVPTHPADEDAEGLDAEVAISQNEQRLLDQVEAALERIEKGTYGVCQQCGKEIGAERLNAIPFAACCIDCARGQRMAEERPVPGEPRRFN
jgi:DnaK suppressor protein